SEEAIEVYDQVIKEFRGSKNEVLLEQVASAMFNKGVTLGTLERSEEAIEVYDQVIKEFRGSKNEVLLEKVASAIGNKNEILLINNKKIMDIKSVKKYIYNKKDLIKLSMIEILYNAQTESQDDEVKKWEENYQSGALDGWSFEELDKWSDTLEGEVEAKVKKYLEVFKEKAL
ncbi:hypothetical protein, partial [Sulfurimonas sp.]|uniref:hypothetical protein n=1 Tax=Sulfurimonas sp. TaxID=2022749 RepID=UPI003D0D4810